MKTKNAWGEETLKEEERGRTQIPDDPDELLEGDYDPEEDIPDEDYVEGDSYEEDED